MSDSTTLHYGLVKPEIDASKTTWGDKLNADLDVIDSTMFSIASAASSTAVLATPPATPSDGMMWWESDTGYLFLRYNDGNSAQWVQLNGIPTALQANYVAKAGDTMTGPLLLAADPVLPLGAATKQYSDTKQPLAGVTDGSNALPGQIGEVISAAVNSVNIPLVANIAKDITSIVITPGDWDVYGEVWIIPTVTGSTGGQAVISTVSATLLPSPQLAASRVSVPATLGTGLLSMALRPSRVSVTAPITYYLTAFLSGQAGNGGGNIIARRAR